MSAAQRTKLVGPISPIPSIMESADVPFAFSFPLSDLLICEFNPVDAVFSPEVCSESVTAAKVYTPLHELGLYRGSRSPKSPAAGSPLSALAELIYQKVIRRKPVPFLRSKKDLKNLGCYIEETLECGHVLTIHPYGLETLTARKRSCHECSGWFGELQLGERKAPTSVKGIVRKRKIAGESPWWAIGFAIGCASLLIVGIFYALQPQDFYQVTDRQSDFNHTLQQVHRGKVLAPAVMFWCEPQPFEAGHTLTSFKFDYHSDKFCYSVVSFSLLRDAATCPIVPKNCAHTNCADPMTDHIVCEGKPQFN